jgi:hypothetical protein
MLGEAPGRSATVRQIERRAAAPARCLGLLCRKLLTSNCLPTVSDAFATGTLSRKENAAS